MKPCTFKWWISLAVMAFVVFTSGLAFAQLGNGLAAVGLVDPTNGFPKWYIDHAGLQQHLDYIKPDFHLRILEQPQVVQRSARQPAPSLGLYGGGGARPIFRGTCFDFDEHQAILIPKDQIHFSAFRAEVGCQEL